MTLRQVLEKTLLKLAGNVAKHIVQRSGWDEKDQCFQVDLREVEDELMAKFRMCLEQYESKRIRTLQADLEVAQHENSLLAELNENLRRWLVANTAASVGAARALGMVDTETASQNGNQTWESLKVVPNTPPSGHKLQMPGRL